MPKGSPTQRISITFHLAERCDDSLLRQFSHVNPQTRDFEFEILPLPSPYISFLCERAVRRNESEREKEMATNIGIMDAAYFVGRSEILSWINSTLQLNLSKVEEVLFSILFLHQIQSGLGLCLISDR